MKINADFLNDFLSKGSITGNEPLHNKQFECLSIQQADTGAAYVFEVKARKIMEANENFFSLLKYSTEDLDDLSVDKIIVADQKQIEGAIDEYLHKGVLQTPLRQYRCKDGEILFIESTIQVSNIDQDQFITVKMRDVTEWQHLQNRMRLVAQVFESASDGIVVTDVKGGIQFANPSFLQTTGYSLTEILGESMRILKSGRHDEHFYHNMWSLLKETSQWKGEIWNKRKNGEVYPEWMVINAIKNDLGQVILYSAIARDLSERMKYEDQIKYQAYHDGLTGLANRRMFYEKMHECLLMAKRYQHIVAIMFVDLDGFKSVNDNFGHTVGDLLLQETSKRLQGCVRETDIVARMGGDEFTLILPRLEINHDVNKVAEQIKQVLNKTFVLNGHTITISCSIGISIFPDDGDNEEILVKKADDAMYKAKQAGKNTYKVHRE